MRRVRRGIDGMIGRVRGRFGRIPVDVVETADAFVIRADLPGFGRRDLSVTAYPEGVRIVADHADDRGTEPRPSRREHGGSRLERMIELPSGIDEHGVVAEYRAGMLTVTATKLPARGERVIPIRTDDGGAERGVPRRSMEAESRETGGTPELTDEGPTDEGPTDEEIREYEERADHRFDRQRDLQRDKSGRQYRRT